MDQVDEVKSKVDIVEVISSYIPLKKSGRNYAALCPFHSEKTPSFMVSPERQVFKCFGCDQSGDVLTFLEKKEGWEFREALEELAKRAGVKLAAFKPTGGSRIKEKLVAINNLTVKFYKFLLNKHKVGQIARDYLFKRGIPQALWEKYDLGFAPSGWETLADFLTKRGYSLSDIAIAGLVIGRGAGKSQGYYDRFRNRLMFPIKDGRGTVLGFAGRLLSDSQKEAKYVNSPETPIFTKGNLLFGLDVGRGAIREKGEVVLVEGEFDVLSSYKAGITNVVASKGTALTQMQVATLSRLCERVILCFDTDLAGDAAARRGIELLDLAGMTIRVAKLGKHKDPDEMAQKDPAGLRKALTSAVDVYDYFIDSAVSRNDPARAVGKKKIGQEVLPIIASISDDLVRAHYIEKLASILGLEAAMVADAVARKSQDFNQIVDESKTGASTRGVTREKYFLALLLAQKEILGDIFKRVSGEDFSDETAGRLFKFLHDIIRRQKSPNRQTLLGNLPKDLAAYVDELFLVDLPSEFVEREKWAAELARVSRVIRRESLARQLAGISQKLSTLQGKSDEKQVATLLARFNKISENIRELVSR
ncbi:MAG: DNA primase [Patescibacteria group bacterium]